MSMSNHSKGLLLTALGVIAVSPDGLLTRLISADNLTITYWRGLFFGYGMLLLVVAIHRRKTLKVFLSLGKAGLFLALTNFLGNLAFIYSITHTSVANTLFIISTTPLFAAIIAWLVLKEKVEKRTWVTIGVAMIGILIICTGKGIGASSLYGDIAGLLAAVTLAVGFSIVRKEKNLEVFSAMALGGILTALCLYPFVSPESTSHMDVGLLFMMGFVMLPVAIGLMFLGPRYIPAAEVGLMLLLESILGPLWVWLALGEEPGVRTLIGGALVVLAIATNSCLSLVNNKNQ